MLRLSYGDSDWKEQNGDNRTSGFPASAFFRALEYTKTQFSAN